MNPRVLTLLGITLTALSAMAAVNAREAARLAQKHTGATPKGPMAVCVTPELDDGRLTYDVRFHDGIRVYECEVDAETGDILDSESKKLPQVADFPPEAPQPPKAEGSKARKGDRRKARGRKAPPPPQTGEATPPEGPITADDARRIALEDLGVTDAKRIRVKRDRDDGRDEFEVEFISGDEEHDYTIDAKTGEIIGHDRERRDSWF